MILFAHMQHMRVLKRDFKDHREDKWDEHSIKRQTGGGYEPHELSNPAFEEYYTAQQIVPEGEWDLFMAALRAQLPTTFRINGSGRFAADLRDRLGRDFLSQFSGDKPIYVRPPGIMHIICQMCIVWCSREAFRFDICCAGMRARGQCLPKCLCSLRVLGV